MRDHARIEHGSAFEGNALRAQIGAPHYFANAAGSDDVPCRHQYYGFGKLHDFFDRMRDVNDRHADFFMQSRNVTQHFALARRIERRQRLVHQ